MDGSNVRPRATLQRLEEVRVALRYAADMASDPFIRPAQRAIWRNLAHQLARLERQSGERKAA